MLSYPEAVSDSSSADGRDNTSHSSPWTFEDGSLNPALRPSNTQRRTADTMRRRHIPGASSLPPYHPDYEEARPYDPEPYAEDDTDSEDEKVAPMAGQVHVRRGSEGLEILPENREEMLRRYLEELGEEPGRYVRYIPQVEDDSESEQDDDDDNIPLAYNTRTM